jgi:hypothetical protein
MSLRGSTRAEVRPDAYSRFSFPFRMTELVSASKWRGAIRVKLERLADERP